METVHPRVDTLRTQELLKNIIIFFIKHDGEEKKN